MTGMINSVANEMDTVVVGGGMAGLVAGATLARAGLRVAVLEKSARTGGRAATDNLDGGYSFNLGPHALYRAGAARKILRKLGIKWTGHLPPTKGAHAIYRRKSYALPAGTLSLLATGLFTISEKIEAARLLSSLPRIDTDSLDKTTLREWLERETRHERVAEFVRAAIHVSTYTNDTEQISAGAAFRQLQLALAGNVDYLDGGWQTLVDEAARVAREAGAQLLTNASVVRIKRDDGGYLLQLRNGEAYRAASVILATGPAAARALVEGSEETILRKWAEESVPVRAACLDVALKHLPNPKRGIFALGIDRPLYLSVHSLSARLVPEGGALIHVMNYLAAGEDEDPRAVRRELEELLDMMQPGWRDVVAHVRYLPRMTVSNSLVKAAQGGTKGRPGPEVPGLAGLYVAGDWVGGEGMLLDASLASAHHAATLILSRQSGTTVKTARALERVERLIA